MSDEVQGDPDRVSMAPLDPEDALRALLAVKPDGYAAPMEAKIYLRGGQRDGQYLDKYEAIPIEGRLAFDRGGPPAVYTATSETVERDGVVFGVWELISEN